MFTPLSVLFNRFGWTRDDARWGWTQLVAFAAIILSAGYDGEFIIKGLAYLGIHVGTTFAHWVVAISAGVLWISGKFDASSLPGAKK
mgnify:FL=1